MTLKASLQARVGEHIRNRLMDRLIASPTGRAHILNVMAEAEGSEEGAIFDILATRVEDARLQQMVRKHAADEERHAELFRARVIANGGTPQPIPEHLRLINRLNAALGDFFDGELSTDEDVMNAYLLLQVIEERAITQFRQLEPVFRTYDPKSADVIAEIAADEDRHLKYCHAISKRYAPDPATRVAALKRLRQIEARAFTDNSRANIQHCVDNGLLQVGRIEQRLWRRFVHIERPVPPVYTTFATAAV